MMLVSGDNGFGGLKDGMQEKVGRILNLPRLSSLVNGVGGTS